MLKESDELEQIVIDLCTSLDLKIISAPQKGVRQDGVDVHAVGVDKSDNTKKNFLITIKRGDIDRTIWESGVQAVRPSLNEILDVYIPQRLGINEKKLPNKIILCCGGDIKQEVIANWNGYVETHSKSNISFETWNGSSLSLLIENYLLTENVFFEEVRRGMRRTLVVLSDTDYDLSHFKLMVQTLLFNDQWQKSKGKTLEKKALKALGTIPLCLGMIFEYSSEANNLKHPMMAAEYSLLRMWDFIQKHQYEKNKKILSIYYQVLNQFSDFGAKYFNKIEPYCSSKDALTIGCRDSITASIITFETIGLLSTMGLTQLLYGMARKDEQGIANAKILSSSICRLIENHGISSSPVFDDMTIDITLAICLLAFTGKVETLKKWLSEIVIRYQFAYVVMEKGFAIGTDSIDDLVDYDNNTGLSKEELAAVSTLLPTIAYWYAILDLKEEFQFLVNLVEEHLKKTNLQLWYPSKGIKAALYSKYVGNEFGIAEAPIYLPKTIEELRQRLRSFLKMAKSNENFESVWNDTPPGLPLIASRHFRTPVIPFFWLSFIEHIETEEKTNGE